jgi:Ca2+:H+ antiporter
LALRFHSDYRDSRSHRQRAAPVIFFSAALAIVPVASLVVRSTEIATRTGDAVGGLLNATFVNAPELTIALVALKAGYADMVRASIIGAILANLLLALGIVMLNQQRPSPRWNHTAWLL